MESKGCTQIMSSLFFEYKFKRSVWLVWPMRFIHSRESLWNYFNVFASRRMIIYLMNYSSVQRRCYILCEIPNWHEVISLSQVTSVTNVFVSLEQAFAYLFHTWFLFMVYWMNIRFFLRGLYHSIKRSNYIKVQNFLQLNRTVQPNSTIALTDLLNLGRAWATEFPSLFTKENIHERHDWARERNPKINNDATINKIPRHILQHRENNKIIAF